MEGEISRDKLREEVVAPYKQNWIGIFSVIVIILSTIATKFPEVMQIPVIQIPDLWEVCDLIQWSIQCRMELGVVPGKVNRKRKECFCSVILSLIMQCYYLGAIIA